jgi:ABC-2 type transport system ATP-binding protein
MIEFSGVTKLYGTVIGVNDLTISLTSGAHGLLGPNGAGKTTFLNLLTDQLKPTMGQVRVFGADPRRQWDLFRRIGVCPGDEALYSNVSGYDWVRYIVELHGFTATTAATRAVNALTRVGMRDAMLRPIGGYSRGMRQRTKIAQAIAHDPELLVLDEPFNGLDPLGRRQVSELLDNWVSQGGCLLVASHLLHEVEMISPSFLLICGGRLLASGTAEEVSQLLADVPNQIRIRCDRPAELAHRLIAEQLVHGVEFSVEFNGQSTLTASTRRPLPLYNRLPELVRQGEFAIYELQSSTESLQALFNSLMSAHRGGTG